MHLGLQVLSSGASPNLGQRISGPEARSNTFQKVNLSLSELERQTWRKERLPGCKYKDLSHSPLKNSAGIPNRLQ